MRKVKLGYERSTGREERGDEVEQWDNSINCTGKVRPIN
jgi:hypothetical protein